MSKLKVTDEMLAEAVANSKSIFDCLRYLSLKLAGGTHSHYSKRIKKLGLSTAHFEKPNAAANRKSCEVNKRSAKSILVVETNGRRQKANLLKRAMLESGVEHKCSKCHQESFWFGHPLTLDIDHINQDWQDNRLENLRFLCPNCHSQFSRNLIK